MSEFKQSIEKALNKTLRKNASDTPDFILAQYLDACLVAFDAAINERDRWYDTEAK